MGEPCHAENVHRGCIAKSEYLVDDLGLRAAVEKRIPRCYLAGRWRHDQEILTTVRLSKRERPQRVGPKHKRADFKLTHYRLVRWVSKIEQQELPQLRYLAFSVGAVKSGVVPREAGDTVRSSSAGMCRFNAPHHHAEPYPVCVVHLAQSRGRFWNP
jgi:hypothetical protein